MMKTITVNASTSYEVKIASGLLATVGEEIRKITQTDKAAIISDSNVFPLYGANIQSALEQQGFQVAVYLFPAGEASKTAQTYLNILQFLADFGMTRNDIVVALGGGVTGDMAGFAAATYMRGIDFVQIPTSLLAMVDSSVGGKTAVDLPNGKNMIGAFHQPKLVLCDTAVLDTLPREYFLDGCGEIVKYGILGDEALLKLLKEHGIAFDRETVVSRCVEMKQKIVERDEFEGGLRQLLNLGHTLAHAVEACTHFTVSHGCAVAIGLAVMARASLAHRFCSECHCNLILDTLRTLGLPIKSELPHEMLFNAMLSDKKRSANTITCIVPYAIGDCRRIQMDLPQIKEFMEAGM